jgi:hypothetical protein
MPHNLNGRASGGEENNRVSESQFDHDMNLPELTDLALSTTLKPRLHEYCVTRF